MTFYPAKSRFLPDSWPELNRSLQPTMSEAATPKKEKKDKKRKSDVAELAPVPPPADSASAEALAMEVDGEKSAKKAKKEKKEKRKSLAADAEDGEDKKVIIESESSHDRADEARCSPNSTFPSMPSPQ